MFNFTVDLENQKEADEATKKVLAALKKLQDIEVLVGIPEEKNERQAVNHDEGIAKKETAKVGGVKVNVINTEMTNAHLLFIHSIGWPPKHIPARPVIEPAIENKKELISKHMANAFKSAMEGNEDKMRDYLKRAGTAGANAAIRWFKNPANGWPPNSAETIRRKGSSRPLIDSGQLRSSIIYVLRDK
jgi:hypothetical protein